MNDLGIDKTITLNGVLATSGTHFALRIQTTPTANPTIGKPFTTRADLADYQMDYDSGTGTLSAGTSRLQINGTHRKFTDTVAVSSGQAVSLTMHEKDLTATSKGSGRRYAVLLVYNGSAWVIGVQWVVDVLLEKPQLWVSAERSLDDGVLVLVRAYSEQTVSCLLSYGNQTQTSSFQGTRYARDGMLAFVFNCPSTVTNFSATVTDVAGNSNTKNGVAPPQSGQSSLLNAPMRWELPTHLPLEGVNGDMFAAIEQGFAQTRGSSDQLNLLTAKSPYLERHARLHGVFERYAEETDSQYRERITAIFAGKFVSRVPLQEHLSAVAGSRVVINDQTSGALYNVTLLDGSKQLDGTWLLGDAGTTFAPATYIVRFTEPLGSTLERILGEFNRLRPAGMYPTLVQERRSTVTLFSKIVGVVTRNGV